MRDSLNSFDLPFKNPFQEEGETKAHFKKRCDRSMSGLKAEQKKLFGCNALYHNSYKESHHNRNGRNHPKRIN